MKGAKIILGAEFVATAVRVHLANFISGGLSPRQIESVEVDRYGQATVTFK